MIKIPASSQTLYDDSEPSDPARTLISCPLDGREVRLALADCIGQPLAWLASYSTIDDFRALLDSLNASQTGNELHSPCKNADGGCLYYCPIHRDGHTYFLVFSYAETQPARWQLRLEGIWLETSKPENYFDRHCRQIVDDWAQPLAEKLQRPADTISQRGLFCGDFSGDIIRLTFEDDSQAIFHYAFYIVCEKRRAIAVFTEHCGYHVYPSRETKIEVLTHKTPIVT